MRVSPVGWYGNTPACITGGIAEAFYKEIPENIIDNVVNILDNELLNIVEVFSDKFG